MEILIVEDEQHIAEGLRFNLEAEGYDVVTISDGETALESTAGNHFDAIVLDVMLPGIDGFEVARTLRARSDFTPILMLTARGRPEDVLEGFAAGTDDYLPKPFDLKIFLARIGSLLRRSEWTRHGSAAWNNRESFTINGRTIDFVNLELRGPDAKITNLTLMEIKLLKYLIENEGTTVSRKTILEDVWDLHEETDTRAIDNFIVRLRKYLEDEPNNPRFLKTVRGIGYRFTS
ncbi:MAG TPA: DNA-binding response regulator [Blastocatellia bacterium]|nr:DNA-binding response regulator [Blastocatellia bacterium]